MRNKARRRVTRLRKGICLWTMQQMKQTATQRCKLEIWTGGGGGEQTWVGADMGWCKSEEAAVQLSEVEASFDVVR